MESIKSLGSAPTLTGTSPGRTSGGETFLDTLKSFSGQVDAQIQEANRKSEEFAVGKHFDLHEIMIASEKADLSFRLLLQIRNKLMDAYQEIMRMQF